MKALPLRFIQASRQLFWNSFPFHERVARSTSPSLISARPSDRCRVPARHQPFFPKSFFKHSNRSSSHPITERSELIDFGGLLISVSLRINQIQINLYRSAPRSFSVPHKELNASKLHDVNEFLCDEAIGDSGRMYSVQSEKPS